VEYETLKTIWTIVASLSAGLILGRLIPYVRNSKESDREKKYFVLVAVFFLALALLALATIGPDVPRSSAP
jgi:uncharacterized membrane protein